MPYLDTPLTMEAAIYQRDALALALGNLMQATGHIRADMPASLTGPDLLYQAEIAAEVARCDSATV